MLLGAHVSISGGVSNAPANATAIGCETYQIFSKNQRQWHAKPYADDEVQAYRARHAESGLQRVVVHDSYLINLGATDSAILQKSIDGFEDEMIRCAQLGIPYLNFHPGAHVGAGEDAGLKRIITSLATILARQDDNPTMLLVENTAGQGTNLGHTFEQVGAILDGVGDERMGLCLDTQHTFAAGYELRDAEGYDRLFATIDDHVGLKRLKAFHLNDSKAALGSHVDRHENLGDGVLGWDLFERLVNDRRFAGIPGNLETPGGPETWQTELAKLKSLRGKKAPDRT